MNSIERTVAVAAPINEVFAMFVDPERLVQWIGIASELDPRPGGVFRFEVQPGQWCSGEYLEVVPPTRVVFSWGWEGDVIPLAPGSSVVEVELAAATDGTIVRLVHRDLPGDVIELHAEGWDAFLTRLVAVLAGEEVPVDPAAGVTPDEVRARLRGPAT